jgi:hypothetical protein
MSTSRAKHHSEQLQSPLFPIPRELRDEIYEYYMLENDGHHYDSATRILFHQPPSVSPRQAVPLGLRITCRRTAEELKNVAPQNLHFYARFSVADGSECMGVSSRAGRFKCCKSRQSHVSLDIALTKYALVLCYVERQKCRMLVCVASLLRPEDFVDLFAHHLSMQGWFKAPLQRAMTHKSDELGASEDFGEDILSQAFGDALQHALVLVKNRNPANFAELACRTFSTDICPMKYVANGIRQSNPFREGALSTVYHWQYAPWCMPNDAELSKLEALLCQPGDFNHQLPMTNQGVSAHFQAAHERWFFSEAAVAIDFCKFHLGCTLGMHNRVP